jgi:hypothetical protein
LAPALSKAVNNAFQPPAVFFYDFGAYFVDCDAIPPPLSITINGVDFVINPRDMIYQGVVDPHSHMCLSAVASGGQGPWVLGDTFLQNVVAIYDVGGAKMRFIGHTYY